MAQTGFDIYQTPTGYVAVTNEVRRTILNALAKRDRQLPELVKITKKAKPTLSSVHMKELLSQKLVEELPHPSDKRKKIYRLAGKRIGSSNLPVDQLRSAVKHYVTLSPLAARLPLPVAMEAIAAAPEGVAHEVLWAQASRLGARSASLFQENDPRELVSNLAAFLEREGLARAVQVDLEERRLDLELMEEMGEAVSDERLALLVAAFVEGVLHEKRSDAPRVRLDARPPRRFSLVLSQA